MKKSILLFSFLLTEILLVSCKKEVEITVPQVVGLTEKIGAIGYKELDEATVKWFLNSAAAPTVNPFFDETGALSATSKQPVSGFTVLPSNTGGKSTRSLFIPKSNYVYISPFGYYLWYYDNDKCDPDFKPKTGQAPKDFLYAELGKISDISKMLASVKVDGVEYLTDKAKFRLQSDIIETTVHKDFNNPNCDYTGQKAKLISDGYAILMKLPQGVHKIEMRGEDTNPATAFVSEVIWNVTVE